MSFKGLTDEQRQRIEENKKRALSRLAEKRSPIKQSVSQETSKTDIGVTVKSKLNAGYIGSIERKPPSFVSNNVPVVEQVLITTTKPDSNHLSTNYNSNKATNSSQAPSIVGRNSTVNFGVWTSKAAAIAERNSLVTKEAFFGLRKSAIKGKCVLKTKNHFSVEIAYNGALIEYFKQFKTRNYDTNSKTWSFMLEEYDLFIKGLSSFKPDIEIEPLPPWIRESFGPDKSTSNAIAVTDLKNVDDKLVQTLMPFQKEGVDFAIHHNGRVLIADDMGLGKTLQAICIAAYYKSEWPLLVVSPSSVRFDWSQQIKKWLPSITDVNVVETGKNSAVSGLVNIISYDLLSKKTLELNRKKFRVIIMDESHFLKNVKAARTRAAMPLLKTAKRVILLSGTPALSRPSELFSQIVAVCPDVFTFFDYGFRYCNAKQMTWGWDYSGSANMQELQLFLEKKIMIRRMKKDVLSQLPSKTRHLVYLDPSSVKKCKSLENVTQIMSKVQLKGQERRELLLQYFHETCRVKLNSVRKYLLDLIESDRKFLVFAHHTEMLDCIEECILTKASEIKYIRIDGRTPSEQRHYLCTKFQSESDYRLAILSITAANAGLNLCAASLVVFAELFWNPGVLVQAEDRVHRIGQEDSVCIQYLIAKGTADDYIWPLIQEKLNILSKVGLAKDDFSHAEETFAAAQDKSVLKIFDFFKLDFINESTELCCDKTLEQPMALQASPQKTKNTSGLSLPSKMKSPFKSQRRLLTPDKHQTSLTSFFECSPPKKIPCLELTKKEPQKHFDESSRQSSQSDISLISVDDTSSQKEAYILEDVDWNEEI